MFSRPTRRLNYNGKLRIHNPLTADDGNLRALEGEVLRKQQPAKQTTEPSHQLQGTTYDPKVFESLMNPYPGTLVTAKPPSGPRSLLASPVARSLVSSIPGNSLKNGRLGVKVLGINE